MKRLLAATALALALISGTVTTAQADNRDRNHNQRPNDHRGERHDNGRNDHRDKWQNDRHDNRQNDHRDNRNWEHRDNRNWDHRDNRNWDHRDNRNWDHRDNRNWDHRDNRNWDHRDNRRYDNRGYDHRNDHRYDRREWDRNYGFRHYDGRRYNYGRYVRPTGYYYRSWGYGDRLPYGYYAPRYVVHNYYAYDLRPPPYGYHYVRVDHDVVLAAIASGIVVSAVFGIFN